MNELRRIRTTHTVDQVRREHPATLGVFARYGIDLCCGGRHTLELVATKHRIPLDALLAELERAAFPREASALEPASDPPPAVP